MPGRVTIDVDPTGVINEMKTYQKRVARALISLVVKYLRIGADKLKSAHMSGSGPDSVASRTGKLKRSVKPGSPAIIGDEIKGSILIDSPYASTHIGKGSITIVPKKAQKLAIPTDFAKTAGGRPRGGPRDPIWGITFIAQGMIWGYKRGTSREYAAPKPLFTLKNSVVVRRRIDPDIAIVQFLKPQMEAEAKQILESATVVGG